MTDRSNRVLLALVALLLMAMGAVGLSFAAGAWGTGAANAHIITGTVVRWWREGSWMSFAAASFVGLVLVALGLVLVVSEVTRHGGRSRLADFDLDEAMASTPGRQGRGRTTVRAAALSHALEDDLSRLPGVAGARVGLFGRPGDLELLARLDVADTADLASLGAGVQSCLERLGTTAGLAAARIDVIVSLVGERVARRVA